MSLITCKDVSFAYDGVTVVSDLNFQISDGDYLCVIGENGSGKSTLIKGLLRLKSPQSGSILFSNDIKRNEIGYLPQQSVSQKDFPASVYEIVLSGRLGFQGLRPFYSRKDKKIALDNIERLGLTSLKHRCYRELSGGQQQRVLLARALCSTQKLLLLDEPVTGLDPIMTSEFYKLIEKINKETNLTIIMVSHDITTAIEYASHVLQIQSTQQFFGKTKDYIDSHVGINFLGGAKRV